MKKILFVIDTLNMGGAQKGLVNFLNALKGNCDGMTVDLLLFARRGAFLNQVPSFVRILEPAKEISCMYEPLGSSEFYKNLCVKGLFGKTKRILTKKRLQAKHPELNDVQLLWSVWRPLIPQLQEEYDIAVGGLEGTCSYYVIDKVRAKRKVLWFHNNYADHGYNSEFDKSYFSQADKVVTVSRSCLDSLMSFFPNFHDKLTVLENITSVDFVQRLAEEEVADAHTEGKLNLLTVGRFQSQKGYDILVDAAKRLKSADVDFVWRCIGDGELRYGIQAEINRLGLGENVLLLGERENPYPYIKKCDLVIQPSRYEGKSIVLDEARALRRPVVVTNYATAHDSVIDGETGVVCDLSGEGVAEKIVEVWQDPTFLAHIIEHLSNGGDVIGSPLRDYLEVYFA